MQMGKKQKYYVVWKGVSPGVYTSWTDCQLQVKGFDGALYKSFDTKEEAELHVKLNCDVFEDDIWVGAVIDGKVQAMVEWCEKFYFGW